MKKRDPKKEWQSLLVQKLMAAKTEDDLEKANDLACELVEAGILTQEEVDALWDDLEPDIMNREEKTMETFAEKFKAARKAAGLTQQGIEDRMQIPRRTVQDWETENRTPPPYVQRFVLNELESIRKE